MDIRELAIELAEKMGLLVSAAMLAALFPPLRRRLLGLGQERDKLLPIVLGICLSMWGAKIGVEWLDVDVNFRAIGVLSAAILGGRNAGIATGVFAGFFYVFRVNPDVGVWGVVESVVDGTLAGLVVARVPELLSGGRTFPTTIAIQLSHVLVITVGLAIAGGASTYLAAWPAHLVQLLVNACGVTLFVLVARLVVAREEAAVALVELRAEADAEALKALRRRLEPHFLFNALNTLRATIRTDPTRARELVADLADMYRYLLHHPEDAKLSDEVKHACAYLAIERARLGDDRLSVESDIAAELGQARVPALLLQPLVENAVKHGVAAHVGPGRVRIVARRQDARITVEVEDQSVGDRLPPREAGSGIALETLRERLSKRYGDEASLRLEPTTSGMRACVTVPYREAPAAKERSAA